MKKLLLILFLLPTVLSAQTVGSTRTEVYVSPFERQIDISDYLDYIGPKIPIQLLNIGIGEEVYNLYPELKDRRVGLGVTNIVVEFFEFLDRFEFTEEKAEIKNRMVTQFEASDAGITSNQIEGWGNIRLAEYFVTVEVYDYSVSEDETINLVDGIKNTVVTRLGLQIRFTDANTGTYFTGSGLGTATTVRELTFMNDDNFSEVKFKPAYHQICKERDLYYQRITEDIFRELINLEKSKISLINISNGLQALVMGLWLGQLEDPDTFNRKQAKQICFDYIKLNFPKQFKKIL